MKFDSLIILTGMNGGFAILSTNGADGTYFFTMSAVWLALALIVGSKGDKND